ncbi:hypothetical protein [Maridesulfovibrio hydrothermalis]|uniref:Beta-barrel porin 2 n=1 Tax=Maridesulfovibrio hydrothermalis AM13 = DSM 14728 TaxID=1121451 RepID=L0RDK5_9BACT|nr:hypothetical protein [Maridesulfovibrio hydrothermalis]CCO24829.1 conserved exported protein of unknown function [Maridesulfovibrio hydrothermalis AM13 = DSM 14728]
MSRSSYRLFRIALLSILLIPVCGVFAQEEPSWRVRMPVILPLENLAEKTDLVHVADLKRPVTNLVISSRPLSNDVNSSIDVLADTDERRTSVPLEHAENISVVNSPAPAADAASGGSVLSAESSGASKLSRAQTVLPAGAGESEVINKDRFSSPSVSLVPSDSAEERRRKGSEDGSFFTTPKRFAGLSGKVVKATPSLSIRETYDSNVDYKAIEDLVTEITPSLKLEAIGEDMNLKFRGDFIYRDYLRYNELDRYDYSLDLSGNYKFSPRLSGGLDMNHKRYHNLDQNTFEAGGFDLDPTIILKSTVTPDLNWRIGERDNLRISNYFDKTDYERKTDSDYVTNVLSFVWGHALPNELTTLFVGQMSTFTHFSREIDDLKSDQVSFQAVFGIDHQFSPGWKLSLKGGPGTTISNYSSDAGRGESQDLLYQFRAELAYRKLKYEIVPAIERVVRPGRYGENEVLDQAEVYCRYEFTEYFTYDMINTYWMIETDGANGGQKTESTGLFTQSVLTWEFEKDWNAFGGFSYNWGRNEISGSSDERFKSWVGISYAFPTEIN